MEMLKNRSSTKLPRSCQSTWQIIFHIVIQNNFEKLLPHHRINQIISYIKKYLICQALWACNIRPWNLTTSNNHIQPHIPLKVHITPPKNTPVEKIGVSNIKNQSPPKMRCRIRNLTKHHLMQMPISSSHKLPSKLGPQGIFTLLQRPQSQTTRPSACV